MGFPIAHNPYAPTPHQVEDSDVMLADQHAHLWADAGTGKTVTALEAFRKGGYERGVVICPKLAMPMWQEEIQKHLGKRAYTITSNNGWTPKRKTGNGKVPSKAFDFIVTTPDLLASSRRAANNAYMKKGIRGRDLRHFLQDFVKGTKSALIIDEAHMLKSRDSQRTKAVLGSEGMYSGFTSVWQLTGTPVVRYYDDLWTQLVRTNPELLKWHGVETYEKWCNVFCTHRMVSYGGGRQRRVVNGNASPAKLEKLLAHAGVIRRKLSDVVDNLPPVTYRSVDPGLSSKVANPKVNVDSLLRELNDPDSVMATVRRELGVAKAGKVVEYALEYASRPCLIGYWHKDVCAEMQEHMGDVRYAVVDGSTPEKERELIRAKFNAGELDFLLGQMQAMNTSWNLQDLCKYVVIAEELPSAAMLHQFISRVYRRGQQNHVQIDEMRTTHNLDVAMAGLRERKAEGVEEIGL